MDREKFETALMSADPQGPLEALQESGELGKALPEVQAMVGFGGGNSGHKDLWWHTKLVVKQCEPIVNVRWAALFHDVGKPPTFERKNGKVTFHSHEAMSAKLWNRAARRLGWFSDQERKDIKFLVYNLGRVEAFYSGWNDSAIRRLSREVGDYWDDLMALAWADSTTKHDRKRSKHHQRMRELMERRDAILAADAAVPALPKGLGDVLCAELGLTPSRELGALMGRLKATVEAGELERQADPSVYVAWAKENHP